MSDLKLEISKLKLLINAKYGAYGNKKDTIYADQTLKAFKKIRKIKKTDRLEETYYYDKDGEIANMLRNKFSFFKECW